MKLVYDYHDSVITFGVEQIKKSLKNLQIFFEEQFMYYSNIKHVEKGILIRKINVHKNEDPIYEEQEFTIRRDADVVIIEGNDSRGVMYGCLEWAECLEMGVRLEDGSEIRQKPAFLMRGIKYNLPYAPFDNGDPLLENKKTCMDMNFWRPYINMLAKNRYNCLSLWSEHPFHLMVVSPKYRDANPYSDLEINHNIQFFRELILYAKSRGIDVYLFTWNIRLMPDVAKALGFPEIVGDFGNMYDELIHRQQITLNRFRAQSSIIKDYFREMILQVLITYPDLKGLGTSASEWMDGTAYEREEWIAETYIQAIKESGRKIHFIHRTNMQNAGKEIKELIQPHFQQEKFFISWKYSNAHAYSHPEPKFEDYWQAWKGVDLDKTQVLYTVRNDDVFTHRWGDPDYVRSYVKGMRKPYVKGFYWGADGYTWGKDFQHINYGHKTWEFDFERHLFQFQLWGRLSYNPNIKNGVWEYLLAEQYGKEFAPLYLEGLRSASKIIPAVNRLFWLDYDFQWHPESCLSQVTGFKTIIDFIDGKAMPGIGVLGIREFLAAEKDETIETVQKQFKETPLDIICTLKDSAQKVTSIIQELEERLGNHKASHSYCTLLDFYAWAELGNYYGCKFEAALELGRYKLNNSPENKKRAIHLLENGKSNWKNLGHYWSLHNKPYLMARVKMTFGYPYYLDDVQRDIEIAKQY